MTHRFRVGDLAIVQNSTYFLEHDGCLALVRGALAERWGRDLTTMTWEKRSCYAVRVFFDPPANVLCTPNQLRPLKDPEQELAITRRKDLERQS